MTLGAGNAKRPWKPEEAKQLRDMAEAGKSIFIAHSLKRTVKAFLRHDSGNTAPQVHHVTEWRFIRIALGNVQDGPFFSLRGLCGTG
jgi:hypothetical protein